MTRPAASSPEVAVRLSGFVKRYKQHLAVDGLDLTVKRGEIYGLIGPDGAGKSSVMKAIAGVLQYEGGSAEVFGTFVDSERAAEQVKRRIGFLPQGLGLNLYPELSVEENIDFFAALRLVPEAELCERKARLLAITRLDRFRGRLMKQLSGGMKQKLGLICTLIHEPELAILDEPTTGVDPVSRRDFWRILYSLLKDGVTIFVSTAYLDEAERCHRVALLHQGRLLACDTPDRVKSLMRGTILEVRVSRAREAAALLKRRMKAESIGLFGDRIHVVTMNKAQTAHEVPGILQSERFMLHGVRQIEPSLEDVFISVLTSEQAVAQQEPTHVL